MTEKIVIPYKIIGVGKHDETGYVATFLEPVEKLNIVKKDKTPQMRVMGVGPQGLSIPKQVQEQIMIMMKEAIPDELRREQLDPRNICHIEPAVDFIPRGWKFGDIINVSLEKIKDANEINPKEYEA